MKPIQILDEAKDSISSLHILGHEIAVGCVDGRARLYDLRMGFLSVDVLGRRCSFASSSICFQASYLLSIDRGTIDH